MTNAIKRVLKWVVDVDDQPHRIGSGKVLHVACQSEPHLVQIWTEEVGVKPDQNRMVQVFGTGQQIPMFADYVGTALVSSAGNNLVWHVYDLATVLHDAELRQIEGVRVQTGVNGQPIREQWP